MDRFSQIFAVDRALRAARTAVSRQKLRELLEDCSESTLTRVVREMRDQLRAPIEYDRVRCGYRYAPQPDGTPFELPGLWFSAAELYALLTCQRLLGAIQPGLLDEHLNPLKIRIDQIFRAQRLKPAEVGRRVRIEAMASRTPQATVFKPLASALLQRRQLQIVYHGRARDDVTERRVSPQRLLHYRDNWYLDAWDHDKHGLRTFSVDRVRSARLLTDTAQEMADAELDAYLSPSYGIFSGSVRHLAVLRFERDRARWVADERWHPDQKGTWLDDGTYELRIPYGDARELVMDIMRYGPDVMVVGPAELRARVAEGLRAAAEKYADRGA